MAAGAVSGNGVYSDLRYKKDTFKLSQWYADAMDAVGQTAFRIAKSAAEDAQERALLTRMYSLGYFSFDAVVGDFGIDLSDELMATFLYHLIRPNNSDVTEALALEMVKADKAQVRRAINEANPQNRQATTPETTAGTAPSGKPSSPSAKTGNASAA